MNGDREGVGGPGPGSAAQRRLSPADPALAVVRAALTRNVQRLEAAEPVARAGSDPEGVHQARVATRNLRSDLRTFAPLLDPEWTRALRTELRWLGDELGAVRDLDVLRAHLDAKATHLDEVDRKALVTVFARLDDQWATARAELERALGGARYGALRRDLAAAARAPVVLPRALEPAGQVIPPLVRHSWKRLRAAVHDLPADPSDEQLHAVRILAKRARYAAEAVEPAFGAPARRFAKAMRQLQDLIGEHQDAVIAQAWLREHAHGEPQAAAFAAGVLSAQLRLDADAVRGAIPQTWAEASARKLRRWLSG